jgi:hypothetical protein
MPNGRCKVHGGKSTGPRTPEGLERSRRANWKLPKKLVQARASIRRIGDDAWFQVVELVGSFQSEIFFVCSE